MTPEDAAAGKRAAVFAAVGGLLCGFSAWMPDTTLEASALVVGLLFIAVALKIILWR